AEHIFTSKKVKDPSLNKGIANAYHEYGRLLDDLGRHDKAKKSRSMAEKWGYVDVVSRHTGSRHPLGKNDTVSRLFLPTAALSVVAADLLVSPRVTAALSVAPSLAAALSVSSSVSVASGVATAIYRDNSKTDVVQLSHQDHILHSTPAKANNGKPTPSKDVMHIPRKIFDQNIVPPITKYTLPEPNGRITNTPQLAYCLCLLHPSMILKEELDQNERHWLQAKVSDPDEHERLQTIATDVIRAFVQEGLKKPGVVAEVVSLSAVLGQDDFRKLLQIFVDGINQSWLLDVHLLNGLALLIRNSPQG
ncbi:hypothetical protein BGZ80_008278, partial [Entomortierella chlamydospora]